MCIVATSQPGLPKSPGSGYVPPAARLYAILASSPEPNFTAKMNKGKVARSNSRQILSQNSHLKTKYESQFGARALLPGSARGAPAHCSPPRPRNPISPAVAAAVVAASAPSVKPQMAWTRLQPALSLLPRNVERAKSLPSQSRVSVAANFMERGSEWPALKKLGHHKGSGMGQ